MRVMKQAVRAVVVAGLLAAGAAAQAQTNAPSATTFARSSGALLERLGEVEAGRPATGVADPATRADLTAIQQVMAHFATPAFPVDGFNTFDSVCGRLNRLSVRYMLDGMGALRQPGPPPTSPDDIARLTARVTQLQSANAMRFQDELFIIVPAVTRCLNAHLPVLARFIAALPPEQLTPVRLDGARQMRRGMTTSLIGLLGSARDPAVRRPNQLAGLQAAGEVMPGYTRQLTLAQRAELRQLIAQLPRSSDAAVIDAERQIDAALSDTSCVELCLLP
jgi:hypothetical protein